MSCDNFVVELERRKLVSGVRRDVVFIKSGAQDNEENIYMNTQASRVFRIMPPLFHNRYPKFTNYFLFILSKRCFKLACELFLSDICALHLFFALLCL